jgi:hypothetical protein
MEAINIIVDQGEGNPGPFDDPDHLEQDHCAIFTDLQTGKETWDVHPVRTNPKTIDYWKEDKRIYQVRRTLWFSLMLSSWWIGKVSVTLHAVYCFLLLNIEKLWGINSADGRRDLVLGNLFSIMKGVLAPLAQFLVQQPIGEKDETAGPSFCFYWFKTGKSALAQVQEEMQAAIDAYLDVTEDEVPQNFGPQLGHQENLLLQNYAKSISI